MNNTMEPDDVALQELNDAKLVVAASEAGEAKNPVSRVDFNKLQAMSIIELRKVAREMSVPSPTTQKKDDLIFSILAAQALQMGFRYGGGTLECLPEVYGFLRPSGLLPSNNDIYVSASQIRRFGLRNGDVVGGMVRPPRDPEHYEALIRVEAVNYSDPEEARRRPMFESLVRYFRTRR